MGASGHRPPLQFSNCATTGSGPGLRRHRRCGTDSCSSSGFRLIANSTAGDSATLDRTHGSPPHRRQPKFIWRSANGGCMDVLVKCRGCGQRMSVGQVGADSVVECPRCHQTTTISNPAGGRPQTPEIIHAVVTGTPPVPIPDEDLPQLEIPAKLDPTRLLICPDCSATKKKPSTRRWFGWARQAQPHPVFCRKCACQMIPADSPRGRVLLMKLLRG